VTTLTEPWAPRGLLVEAHLTANTSMGVTGGATAVVGTVATNNAAGASGTFQATVGVIAGRRYETSWTGQLFSTVAGDDGSVTLTVSGAAGAFQISGCRVALPNTGAHPGRVEGVFYPTASGSWTVTVAVTRTSGTGAIDMQTGSMLKIRDAGLAPS
jgi:hypothetical protein